MPVRQAVWGRLAVSNFFLGGTGAGAYILAVLFDALRGERAASGLLVIRGLAPLLVWAGFLSVALEAGQPWRGWRVLTNVRQSWMSRELLAGVLFVALALGDVLWPHSLLKALAAAAASILMVSQGLMLRRAQGVPAWNQPWLPWLFLASGLLSGSAALLGGTLLSPMGLGGVQLLGLTILGLTLVDLGLWLAYVHQPRTNAALAQALRCLMSPWRLGSIVGVGHIVPLLLLGLGLRPSPASPSLLGAACVALLLGGLSLKDSLVTKAGYCIGLPIPRRSRSPGVIPHLSD